MTVPVSRSAMFCGAALSRTFRRRLVARCSSTAASTVSRLNRVAGRSAIVGSGASRIKACSNVPRINRAETRFCS
ncbi:hypothetical protein D3C80_1461080 [compost metagenome]